MTSPRTALRTSALLLIVPLIAACGTSAGVMPGSAKAFSEDHTFVLMDRQHDVVGELAKDRGSPTVHETHHRREVLAVTGDGRLTPVLPTAATTEDGDGEDDDETDDPSTTSPALPAYIEGGAARPYESVFAEQLDHAALARSYEALFSGDTDVLDTSRAVSLIRVDLSVGGANVPARSLSLTEDERYYALAYFDVSGPPGSDVRVYALSPAKASIIARESMARSVLEDYTGGVSAPVAQGALDAALTGRLQRQREEQFTSLAEHPIQFALHGERPNQFAFAFGPRRRIVKRSWINPKRWLGSAFRFDYDIEPGPRWAYALVVHDASVTQLDVRTSWRKCLVREEEVGAAATECAGRVEARPATRVKVRPAQRFSAPAVHGELYPSTKSTIAIDCASPVNGESRVFVGPVAVPQDDVRLLGRHRLAVTVKKSDLLEDMRKTAAKAPPGAAAPPPLQVDVRVVTPGAPDSVAKVTVQTGPASKDKQPDPEFTVKPTHGSPGQLLTVTFKEILQASVSQVRLGGVVIPRADFVIDAKKKKELRIVIPQPGRVLPAGPQPLTVDYAVVENDNTVKKQVVITDVFTYLR